ncbi:restriction endonuclease subunit S [Solibacillus sp. MA9]|uniref:Restriction endonuclease subunit S n=1 Tax=Solibacillus palustris TaxID=2908203 RepID=A0ABS9UEY5_9BACL|nr:restriction endonuclease subunit S [Solibacillus sp. MA9]MCH7322909.1 restriction endonuclease subunit S [Solibacillus sp. MA9]
MMTENNQNLVPEIRFNNFTNAWEKRTWLDTVDISTNMVDPKTGYYDELPHIGPGNIESFTGILSNVRLVREENLISSKFHFRSGDIIYGKIRPNLAKYVLIDFEGLASADAYVLNSKNGLEQSFLYRILQNKDFYDYSVSVSQRTGMPKINREELNQYNFLMPCSKEQIAIGNFFRTFDDTFTLHKRKLDGLRELKKGYLQQMFPQAGQREPRVRFAGFSGEWQEQKLGELFKERNERSSEGELISVTINSGVIKASELERKDNSSEDKSNYKKVEVGDIAYNSMRMWQGASGISNYAGILSPAYTVIIPNEGVDSLFISYMFKLTRMIEIFQSFSQGLTSDTWNLKFPLLKEIYVTVPCSNEQAAISDFFSIIDEQITAQAIKLEQLRQLKAAYLQRMFI